MDRSNVGTKIGERVVIDLQPNATMVDSFIGGVIQSRKVMVLRREEGIDDFDGMPCDGYRVEYITPNEVYEMRELSIGSFLYDHQFVRLVQWSTYNDWTIIFLPMSK